MPHFDILKTYNASKTFRASSIVDLFTIDQSNLSERFIGHIDIEDKDWNVGLIVGGSGSGKSTIARECFDDWLIEGMEYKAASVIDDMPSDFTAKQVAEVFTSVGFASPPSWLKPYGVLSNGEKMRVDLARAIMERGDRFAFDEFTSVVDRRVAQTGSAAIAKAVRKRGGQFVAVTCHHDVTEWLEPDWIYDTDQQRFFFCAGEWKRPEIRVDVYEVTGKWRDEVWRPFAKHHYLDHNLNRTARQFVGVYDGQVVAHTGVIQFPMRTGWKRIHRLVVLPDYQGVGIGVRFINAVAALVASEGYNVNLTTTTPALVGALKHSPKWALVRKGVVKLGDLKDRPYASAKRLGAAGSSMRPTFSFNFHP